MSTAPVQRPKNDGYKIVKMRQRYIDRRRSRAGRKSAILQQQLMTMAEAHEMIAKHREVMRIQKQSALTDLKG